LDLLCGGLSLLLFVQRLCGHASFSFQTAAIAAAMDDESVARPSAAPAFTGAGMSTARPTRRPCSKSS
jgi:hypothetical protein